MMDAFEHRVGLGLAKLYRRIAEAIRRGVPVPKALGVLRGSIAHLCNRLGRSNYELLSDIRDAERLVVGFPPDFVASMLDDVADDMDAAAAEIQQ